MLRWLFLLLLYWANTKSFWCHSHFKSCSGLACHLDSITAALWRAVLRLSSFYTKNFCVFTYMELGNESYSCKKTQILRCLCIFAVFMCHSCYLWTIVWCETYCMGPVAAETPPMDSGHQRKAAWSHPFCQENTFIQPKSPLLPRQTSKTRPTKSGNKSNLYSYARRRGWPSRARTVGNSKRTVKTNRSRGYTGTDHRLQYLIKKKKPSLALQKQTYHSLVTFKFPDIKHQKKNLRSVRSGQNLRVPSPAS